MVTGSGEEVETDCVVFASVETEPDVVIAWVEERSTCIFLRRMSRLIRLVECGALLTQLSV